MHLEDDDDPFAGKYAVPRGDARKALSIGKTKCHELIKQGVLEVVDLGPRSKPISVASIRRALRNGVGKVSATQP